MFLTTAYKPFDDCRGAGELILCGAEDHHEHPFECECRRVGPSTL